MICDYCEEEEAKEGEKYCQECIDRYTTEVSCQGCETVDTELVLFGEVKYHCWNRSDAYGIPTGIWCDKCFNSCVYPYKRDKYDYQGAGESLDYNY